MRFPRTHHRAINKARGVARVYARRIDNRGELNSGRVAASLNKPRVSLGDSAEKRARARPG